MCPHDGLVFPGNNHCYQLVVEKAEWLEAQQHCQEHGNGEPRDPELPGHACHQVSEENEG